MSPSICYLPSKYWVRKQYLGEVYIWLVGANKCNKWGKFCLKTADAPWHQHNSPNLDTSILVIEIISQPRQWKSYHMIHIVLWYKCLIFMLTANENISWLRFLVKLYHSSFAHFMHLLISFFNFTKRYNNWQLVKIQTFRTPIDTGIPMLDSFANILPAKYCQFCFK